MIGASDQQELFLQNNCFYCERLKARISYRQCELHRSLPREPRDSDSKKGVPRLTHKPVLAGHRVAYKPYVCENCSGPKDVPVTPVIVEVPVLDEKEVSINAEVIMRTCTVPGCNRKHLARGFCKNHYQQNANNAGRVEVKEKEEEKLEKETKPIEFPTISFSGVLKVFGQEFRIDITNN